MTAPRTTELCRNCCFAALFVLIRKSNMWPLAPPRPCDCYPAEPAGARHAASVRSRTIMKRQSLAGTTADFYNVRLGPFLPRLTESTADRWLKATTQLFLTFNGEENGRCIYRVSRHTQQLLSHLALLYSWQIAAEVRRDWIGGDFFERHAALSGTAASTTGIFVSRVFSLSFSYRWDGKKMSRTRWVRCGAVDTLSRGQNARFAHGHHVSERASEVASWLVKS